MSRQTVLMFASVVIVAASLVYLNFKPKSSVSRSPNETSITNPLVLFCAASNRAVMEEIRQSYEKECGHAVQIQYGASQTLLSSLEVSGTGDLYLPADDSFIQLGKSKGLLEETLPLATMRGVIAVPRGNPKGIQRFEDLLQSKLRLVQASPDATAIGKRTREVLRPTGAWDQIEKHTVAFRTTVNDVANDLKIGAADAGIVYDAVLHAYPELEAVSLKEMEPIQSNVSIAVTRSCKQPQRALHFARYVAARDRGLQEYGKQGFAIVTGDRWNDEPEISVFAGSMLRPAIEETLKDFEKREGVKISRVYNGCGILVAQMKAGQHPDAYFACDREFMSQVPDLFPKPVDVSMNELVILVQKGNPLGIQNLRDLTRKGLRVGIGHEKQCAMGWITQNTIREAGIQSEVMANVTVQTPTGDMLVNQLRAGSLDAAVVYISNAAGAADHLDALRIQGLACSVAVQPFAIAEDSQYPQLTNRLFQRLCSAESEETFTAEGFQWKLNLSKDASTEASHGQDR
jgi:molybdenum ABC transporter molybdate-binding protein